MRWTLVIGVIGGMLLGGCGAEEVPDGDLRSRLGPDEHVMVTPDEVDWEAGPESLPEGSEIAVLEGDPREPGMLNMRLRFPDGYVVPPHWHPNFERITVIDGTLRLGMGEEFDEEAMETLPAGSYTVMPPEERHFVAAEGETVIQITTVGPWEIHYVNEAEDPRR